MPRRKTIHDRSLRCPSRPKRRSAWAAGASGSRAAAGQPRKRAIGCARSAPIQPKLPLTDPTPPTNLEYPSAANAPARKIAKRRRKIPRISRASAELEGELSRPFRPELGDLPVLVDRDHRIGVHFRGGGEVVTKSCLFERLSVGRFFEDFRDVVAIFFFDQHRSGRRIIHHYRFGAFWNRPNITSRAGGVFKSEAALLSRADNRDVRIRAGRDLHHGQDRCKVDVRSYNYVTGALNAQQSPGSVGGRDEDGFPPYRLGGKVLGRVAQVESGDGVHLLF